MRFCQKKKRNMLQLNKLNDPSCNFFNIFLIIVVKYIKIVKHNYFWFVIIETKLVNGKIHLMNKMTKMTYLKDILNTSNNK